MTPIAMLRITTLLEVAAAMVRQRDADKARILDACLRVVRAELDRAMPIEPQQAKEHQA